MIKRDVAQNKNRPILSVKMDKVAVVILKK